MTKGWKQGLDNGVLGNPPKTALGRQQGSVMNFYDVIAEGENPNGQCSIVPGGRTCEGTSVEWNSYYNRSQPNGERWGKRPTRKTDYDPWSY